MMDARRLEKLPCGHWMPENEVCRRQTPLWIQTPDASKISLSTQDTYKNNPQDARRQTYSSPLNGMRPGLLTKVTDEPYFIIPTIDYVAKRTLKALSGSNIQIHLVWKRSFFCLFSENCRFEAGVAAYKYSRLKVLPSTYFLGQKYSPVLLT